MIRKKSSGVGIGYFTAANSPSSPGKNELSVNVGDKSSRSGSVNGQAKSYMYSTEEACELVMEYATVNIDDSTAMKSAISVSTASTTGVCFSSSKSVINLYKLR